MIASTTCAVAAQKRSKSPLPNGHLMLRHGLVAAAAVIVIDRVSKAWLLDYLADMTGRVELAPFFNLVMVWNRGISFGLFQSGEAGRWLLTALSLVIVAGLSVWLYRARVWYLAVAIGAVIGGALGNVIDRLLYGAVADFFDFHAAGYHWPAFNVADAAIVSGVGVIVLLSLLTAEDEPKKNV